MEPKLATIGKSDADKAVEYKDRVADALKQVGLVMDEASAEGLEINFQLGRDFAKRVVIVGLTVSRHY